MTAPTYDTLTTDDTGADKILTTGTVTALDQNPVSIAQRGTSAPRVQVPVREYLTSGTGATWNIPAGVTAFDLILQGGGAGTNGDGGDTTFTYNSVTYTAEGGNKADVGGAGPSGTGGGTTNGDSGSVSGQNGVASGVYIGGSSMLGHGGVLEGNGSNSGTGYGQGSAYASAGSVWVGGAGGTLRKRIDVVSGQTSGTYTVGAAGSAGGGAAGGAGIIVIEY